MFSQCVVHTDYYLAKPIPGIDVAYSEFRCNDVYRLPIIRIYGSTPAGQKTCSHIHGVFPYLLVPHCSAQQLDDQERLNYYRQFATSLDKAINVAMGRFDSTQNHVFNITGVAGIPFYGYQEHDKTFMKIYFYNPMIVKKASDLLSSGAVMDSHFQPFESHIPYRLQFFIDFNIYGMNFIEADAVRFRVREDEEPLICGDFNTTDRSIDLESHLWNVETITSDVILSEQLAPRLSHCELEVDISAEDILNRSRLNDNIGENPGIRALWDDERERKREANQSFLGMKEFDLEESRDDILSESDQLLLARFDDLVSRFHRDESSPDVTNVDDFLSASQEEEGDSEKNIVEDDDDEDMFSTSSTPIMNQPPSPVINEESIRYVLMNSQSFSKERKSQSVALSTNSSPDLFAHNSSDEEEEEENLSASSAHDDEDGGPADGNGSVDDVDDTEMRQLSMLPEEDEFAAAPRTIQYEEEEADVNNASQELFTADLSILFAANEEETCHQNHPASEADGLFDDDEEFWACGGQTDGANDTEPAAPKRKRLGARGPVISTPTSKVTLNDNWLTPKPKPSNSLSVLFSPTSSLSLSSSKSTTVSTESRKLSLKLKRQQPPKLIEEEKEKEVVCPSQSVPKFSEVVPILSRLMTSPEENLSPSIFATASSPPPSIEERKRRKKRKEKKKKSFIVSNLMDLGGDVDLNKLGHEVVKLTRLSDEERLVKEYYDYKHSILSSLTINLSPEHHQFVALPDWMSPPPPPGPFQLNVQSSLHGTVSSDSLMTSRCCLLERIPPPSPPVSPAVLTATVAPSLRKRKSIVLTTSGADSDTEDCQIISVKRRPQQEVKCHHNLKPLTVRLERLSADTVQSLTRCAAAAQTPSRICDVIRENEDLLRQYFSERLMKKARLSLTLQREMFEFIENHSANQRDDSADSDDTAESANQITAEREEEAEDKSPTIDRKSIFEQFSLPAVEEEAMIEEAHPPQKKNSPPFAERSVSFMSMNVDLDDSDEDMFAPVGSHYQDLSNNESPSLSQTDANLSSNIPPSNQNATTIQSNEAPNSPPQSDPSDPRTESTRVRLNRWNYNLSPPSITEVNNLEQFDSITHLNDRQAVTESPQISTFHSTEFSTTTTRKLRKQLKSLKIWVPLLRPPSRSTAVHPNIPQHEILMTEKDEPKTSSSNTEQLFSSTQLNLSKNDPRFCTTLSPISSGGSNQTSITAFSKLLKKKDVVNQPQLISASPLTPANKSTAFRYSLNIIPEIGAGHFQRNVAGYSFKCLTILSVELVCQTRGNLSPDPALDAILAVCYSVIEPGSEAGGSLAVGEKLPKGVIYIEDNSKSKFPGYSIYRSGTTPDRLAPVRSEEDLFYRLADIIRDWDPDILIGYETNRQSWGYLLQRGNFLSLNPGSLFSRLKYARSQFTRDTSTTQANPAETISNVTIAGRIVLNLWRVLRNEVTLNIYTFENCLFHILHERIPKFEYKQLTEWYQTDLHRWRVIDYFMLRSVGNNRLMLQLDLLDKTCEFARIFGIEFYDVLSRGSQFRVESMMLRIAKPLNLIAVSPNIHQRANQRTAESVPLNLEPDSQLATDPVVVLDFQSLYPSIMIAYNYCFSTAVGRLENLEKINSETDTFEFGCLNSSLSEGLLKKLQGNVTISPNGVVFVKQSVKKGILPKLVEDLLKTRLMVKKAMKDLKGHKGLSRLLDARQLGLKLIANVTYGYTNANFSGRMPCIEILERTLRLLFSTLSRDKVKQFVSRQCSRVIEGNVNLQDFIIAKEYRGRNGYKPNACVPALHLARQFSAQDSRSEPNVGERVPYVVIIGEPGDTLIKCIRSPVNLLHEENELKLNIHYYIEKQILPPLHRALSLINCNVFRWFAELPRRTYSSNCLPRPVRHPTASRPHFSRGGGSGRAARTISSYFDISSKCAACDHKAITSQRNDAPGSNFLCQCCLNEHSQYAFTVLTDKIGFLVNHWSRLSSICATCSHLQPGVEISCVSLDCPIRFERIEANKELEGAFYTSSLCGQLSNLW